MDDLVKRLRVGIHTSVDPLALTNEAADRIEAQDKRNKELEAELRDVYEVYAGSEGIPQPMTAAEGYLLRLVKEMANIARAALGEKKDG